MKKKKQIRTWLKFQAVTVNGQPVSQFDHLLQPGDTITIRTDRFAIPRTRLTSGLQIYFEDAHLMVVEKPAGLLSIASAAESERTAYFQLTEYLRHKHPRSRERVWIVHRLDCETSGLMVFAKTASAKEMLQSHWDTFEKRYEAVTEGRMPAQKGVLASDLDESNPHHVTVRPPLGPDPARRHPISGPASRAPTLHGPAYFGNRPPAPNPRPVGPRWLPGGGR